MKKDNKQNEEITMNEKAFKKVNKINSSETSMTSTKEFLALLKRASLIKCTTKPCNGVVLSGDGFTLKVQRLTPDIAWSGWTNSSFSGNIVINLTSIIKIVTSIKNNGIRLSVEDGTEDNKLLLIEVVFYSGSIRKYRIEEHCKVEDMPVSLLDGADDTTIHGDCIEISESLVPKFRKAISDLERCASNDESRPYINGIWFSYCAKDVDRELTMVGVDGHRLLRRLFEVKIDSDIKTPFMLKMDVINIFKSMISQTNTVLAYSWRDEKNNKWFVMFNSTYGEKNYQKDTLIFRYNDISMPPLDAVIPKIDFSITVDTKTITEAVAAAVSVDPFHHEINVTTLKTGQLKVSAEGSNFKSKFEETISCTTNQKDDEIKFCIDYRYITDAIKMVFGDKYENTMIGVPERSNTRVYVDGAEKEVPKIFSGITFKNIEEDRLMIVMPINE